MHIDALSLSFFFFFFYETGIDASSAKHLREIFELGMFGGATEQSDFPVARWEA